jgi:hypothetical protein
MSADDSVQPSEPKRSSRASIRRDSNLDFDVHDPGNDPLIEEAEDDVPEKVPYDEPLADVNANICHMHL